jgi:hypothetical protein
MSGGGQQSPENAACVCGADEPCTARCDRHQRDLHGYPCGECSAEWAEAHPRTSTAISNVASGKGSPGAYKAAKRADAAAHTEPCRWRCTA